MSALKEIPTADINPNELNPRRTVGDVAELAQSIESQGLVQPIVIAPAPDATDGEWVIIAGHRRFAAIQHLGWMHVPALVRDDLTDPADVISAMLIENGQRNDLKITEEGDALLALDDLGLTHTEISKRAGRSQKWTKTRLTVAGLPESMRNAVDDGQLTISDAVAFAELPDAQRERIDVTETPATVSRKINTEITRRRNLENEQVIRDEATEAGYSELDVDGDDQDDYSYVYVRDDQTPPEGAKFTVDSYDGYAPPTVRWYKPTTEDDTRDDDAHEKHRQERQAKVDRALDFAATRYKDIATVAAGGGPELVDRILRSLVPEYTDRLMFREVVAAFGDIEGLANEEIVNQPWFAELDTPSLAAIVWAMNQGMRLRTAIGFHWNGELVVDTDMIDRLSDVFDFELSAEEQEFIAEHDPDGQDDDESAGAA